MRVVSLGPAKRHGLNRTALGRAGLATLEVCQRLRRVPAQRSRFYARQVVGHASRAIRLALSNCEREACSYKNHHITMKESCHAGLALSGEWARFPARVL